MTKATIICRGTNGSIRLTAGPDGLRLKTPYDREFIAAFKAAIPVHGRTWQKAHGRWLVDPIYGHKLQKLLEQHYGITVELPAASSAPAAAEVRVIRLDYLGRCKERGNGESSAYGYVDGGWNLIVSEAVLRTWFNASEPAATASAPAAPPTLYAVLTVSQTADETAIKKAFRRLALQWHPDRCREPDAADQFRRINEAYQVLSDPQRRRKYDAGLAFEASLSTSRIRAEQQLMSIYDDGYRAPLRCGLLLVEGQAHLGRFVATKILDWQDIVDDRGRTMIASWPAGADMFVMEWV